MLRRLLFAALVLLTLGTRQATAEVITWQFTGTVDAVSAGVSSFFPAGTGVEFTLTYDADWIPLLTSSTENSYAPTSSTPAPFFDYNISIGGHEFFRSSSGLPFLRAQPDRLVLDTSLSGSALDGLPVGSGPQWWPIAFDAGIALPAGPIALPTLLPGTLSDSTFVLYLSSLGPGCISCVADASVSGALTSATRIPAPSTLSLLGLGFAAFTAWRRRRALL